MPKYTPEQQARIDAANAKMREKEARKRATGSMRPPSRTECRFASRSDHDKKLAMVLNDGYEAWGYLIEQDDRVWERDHITKIEATVTNRIYQLRLALLQDGLVQGVVTNEVQLKI